MRHRLSIGHLVAPLLVLLRPEVEVAEGDADHVAQRRVLLGVAKLHHVRLAGVVDHALLEALHLEHLHLDHEAPPRGVGALHVDDGEL
jgi:hypothetical protein